MRRWPRPLLRALPSSRGRARERTLPPLPLVEERETMNESLYERGCWHDSLNRPQIPIGEKLDLLGSCTLSLVTVGQSLWDDIKILELGLGHLISKF